MVSKRITCIIDELVWVIWHLQNAHALILIIKKWEIRQEAFAWIHVKQSIS